MDLKNAYERFDWVFLFFILIQIGIPKLVLHWVMACVTTLNIALLINGAPSRFFKSTRGIRQGCPIYSLLFLLIIEGLSRLLIKAKNEGKIKGIKLEKDITLSDLLFVDDISY